MPTDGIVRQTALDATQGAKSDVEKVQRLYDWVVANTHREPKVRGCGVGDIKAMLETGNMGGKCGDINALFVGLCRSVGVPARDVYGIRLVPSAFGYRELGGNPAKLQGAQHCRAEVFLAAHGWVAMDPADVGKVMRLETGEWIKDVDHPVVAPVKKALFGGWEGNWMAFNTAHDVALPGCDRRRQARLPDVPAGRERAGPLRRARPRQFQVHHHGARDRLSRIACRSVSRSTRSCSWPRWPPGACWIAWRLQAAQARRPCRRRSRCGCSFGAELFVVVALMFTCRVAVADWPKVPSGSMEPTLRVGDYLLVNHLAYGPRLPFTNTAIEFGQPQRGDVVVFRFPLGCVAVLRQAPGRPAGRRGALRERRGQSGRCAGRCAAARRGRGPGRRRRRPRPVAAARDGRQAAAARDQGQPLRAGQHAARWHWPRTAPCSAPARGDASCRPATT